MSGRARGSKLYAIQAENGGPIKFGRTTDLRRRLADLQAGNPSTLRVLASHPSAGEAEPLVHAVLSDDRVRGEWFADGPRARSIIEVMARYRHCTIYAAQLIAVAPESFTRTLECDRWNGVEFGAVAA